MYLFLAGMNFMVLLINLAGLYGLPYGEPSLFKALLSAVLVAWMIYLHKH